LKAHPQIDAVLPTMGGQTALNLCLEADEKNLARFLRMIGVDVNAINITENREQFKQLLKRVPSAPAEICTSYLRGKEIAQEFGFP
jgi:carbamoyl-phosphate synthase large subunit